MAAVAALFGYRGTIATYRNAVGVDARLDAPAGIENIRAGKNLVVLTNYNTMADAEVLAVALREENEAWIVGDFTFGTSTICRRYSFSGFLLTVTVGRVRIGPHQLTVDPKGQAPDYWVNLDREPLYQGRDVQIEGAQLAISKFPIRDGQ
jgi:C-terminal processing protease CtpA/Prc